MYSANTDMYQRNNVGMDQEWTRNDVGMDQK